MSFLFSLQTFTNLSTKECYINIVGEDNKSIIHHKIAAHVVCVLPEQDHPHHHPRQTAPTPITSGPTPEQTIHLPILSNLFQRLGTQPAVASAWPVCTAILISNSFRVQNAPRENIPGNWRRPKDTQADRYSVSFICSRVILSDLPILL
jgi:hypothetical protein